MDIQWYPGHMTKTRRMMEENLALVDVVVEILDARLPYSSKNPDIDALAKQKKRILILNKCDLAQQSVTQQWKEHYIAQGFSVLETECSTGKGVKQVTETARQLMKEKLETQKSRGRLFRPIRAMIVGIPNVGKSTFINQYVGKATAKTGDKPGVTRGKQWIKVKNDFELLDTPGILWPKFEDETAGLLLAFTGAINDEILDSQTLAARFLDWAMQWYPASLLERYGLAMPEEASSEARGFALLEEVAIKRGMKGRGGSADILRASKVVLDEFRGGKLGRMTLETPQQIPDRMAQAAQKEKDKAKQKDQRKKQYRARQ